MNKINCRNQWREIKFSPLRGYLNYIFSQNPRSICRNSRYGSTSVNNVVKCVQPWFSMYICAKQAQIETKSPLVHPRTKKAIGVDLLFPPIVYPPRYSQ